jgi:four helix bundle protein
LEEKVKKYDLEERLIAFAIQIINLTDQLPVTKAGSALGNQIVRSGTSPALNYGEAQSAESKKDFIHKLKIILKELRETHICLKIIQGSQIKTDRQIVSSTMNECNELISIFVKSVETAKSKIENEN